MTHRDHLLPNVGTLGKKVERRKSEPIRQDEEVAPGIFRDSQGRLYTRIPERPSPPPTIPIESQDADFV